MVARGGIEPPTQGFSVLLQIVYFSMRIEEVILACILNPIFFKNIIFFNELTQAREIVQPALFRVF